MMLVPTGLVDGTNHPSPGEVVHVWYPSGLDACESWNTSVVMLVKVEERFYTDVSDAQVFVPIGARGAHLCDLLPPK
eukprot:m.215582 g.215582  ORF g.215582 m.215582 type:complete len:77 (-) comp18641_c0_seq1:260-490(-)